MTAFMTTMGSTNWFTCGAMAKITPLRKEEIEVSDEEGALLSFPYLPSQLHTRAPRVMMQRLHSHSGPSSSALALSQLILCASQQLQGALVNKHNFFNQRSSSCLGPAILQRLQFVRSSDGYLAEIEVDDSKPH